MLEDAAAAAAVADGGDALLVAISVGVIALSRVLQSDAKIIVTEFNKHSADWCDRDTTSVRHYLDSTSLL